MTTKQPKLRLTKSETHDHCFNLFVSGKFSELLAFSGRYKAPKDWVDKSRDVLASLVASGVPEDLFASFVRRTTDACLLSVVSTWYKLQTVGDGFGICLELTVSRKHLSEGGRIAEEFSVLNQLRYTSFSRAECILLAPVALVLLVDDYDDGDEDQDDENENAEGTCSCPSCVGNGDEEDEWDDDSEPATALH